MTILNLYNSFGGSVTLIGTFSTELSDDKIKEAIERAKQQWLIIKESDINQSIIECLKNEGLSEVKYKEFETSINL